MGLPLSTGNMAWSPSRAGAVAAAVALFAVSAALLFPSGPTQVTERPGESRTVAVGDGGPEVWPYLSPSSSFDNPSISVNIVVHGDERTVRRYLLEQGDVEWNETREENGTGAEALSSSNVSWVDSPGGKLYLYVSHDGEGRWMSQTYQFHHGTYFGHQYHVRAYQIADRDENVTVMQAHTEHWDWFTITHTVDGLQEARRRVEADFRSSPFIDDIHRVYYGNGDTFDADGWATVIRTLFGPAGALLVSRYSLGTLTRRFRADGVRRGSQIGLVASLIAIVLGVRAGGILFEQLLPALAPNTVVRILYPLLVFGVPACAYYFGRRLSADGGFALGAVGLGAAILLDYAFLGVGVLPVPILVHRVGVAVAAGFVAAGAGSDDDLRSNGPLLAGVGLWALLVTFAHLA